MLKHIKQLVICVLIKKDYINNIFQKISQILNLKQT
jgi:hypothetical protein